MVFIVVHRSWAQGFILSLASNTHKGPTRDYKCTGHGSSNIDPSTIESLTCGSGSTRQWPMPMLEETRPNAPSLGSHLSYAYEFATNKVIPFYVDLTIQPYYVSAQHMVGKDSSATLFHWARLSPCPTLPAVAILQDPAPSIILTWVGFFTNI